MESQAASLSLNKLDFSGSCGSPYGLYSPQLFTPHKTRNGELSIMCRNRHCPKCQSLAKAHWLEARQAELLPVPYAPVVFTLPQPIAALASQHKAVVYGLLFRAAAET